MYYIITDIGSHDCHVTSFEHAKGALEMYFQYKRSGLNPTLAVKVEEQITLNVPESAQEELDYLVRKETDEH